MFNLKKIELFSLSKNILDLKSFLILRTMIKSQFEDSLLVLQTFISEPVNFENIEAAANLMSEALKQGNKIISCGNGGSMCDAMHFAEELSGKFRNERPSLAAISISDPSHITCVGNDYGFAFIFSKYVEAVGKPGDILLAISTSGNSENVLLAIKSAHCKGMKVIGLTGKDGGAIGPLCDIEIRVSWNGFSDRIQEVHIKIIHSLILAIEKNLGY